jgi:cysteine-rich repeat protein
MRYALFAILASVVGAGCTLDAKGLAPAAGAGGPSGGTTTAASGGSGTTTGSETGAGGATHAGGAGGATTTTTGAGGTGGATSTGGAGGAPSPCGNGAIDTGEECDGALLDGATCASRGFSGGDLGCTADCHFDESKCVAKGCGNGFTDPGEACDDGDKDTCTGTCNADCSGPANACGDGVVRCGEACDGADLGGKTCKDFGFANPVGLKCTSCQLDKSGCKDSCGDGKLDPGEACDDRNQAPADGKTDFCSADCQVSTWPCGAWPGYIAATTSGASITFTNIAFNDVKTRYAVVAAGSTFKVTGHYTYDVQGSGCPGCLTEINWGLFAGPPPASNNDPATGFPWCSDKVASYPDRDFVITPFDAPSQKGTYYFRWERTWDYTCVDTPDPGDSHDLAVLCVQ